jgi:hypothetical protein
LEANLSDAHISISSDSESDRSILVPPSELDQSVQSEEQDGDVIEVSPTIDETTTAGSTGATTEPSSGSISLRAGHILRVAGIPDYWNPQTLFNVFSIYGLVDGTFIYDDKDEYGKRQGLVQMVWKEVARILYDDMKNMIIDNVIIQIFPSDLVSIQDVFSSYTHVTPEHKSNYYGTPSDAKPASKPPAAHIYPYPWAIAAAHIMPFPMSFPGYGVAGPLSMPPFFVPPHMNSIAGQLPTNSVETTTDTYIATYPVRFAKPSGDPQETDENEENSLSEGFGDADNTVSITKAGFDMVSESSDRHNTHGIGYDGKY